jgi:(2Fe-2S) ferredoxin
MGVCMMKPDFKAMSKEDLRAYVLAHRNDDEAVRELFSRRSPNSVRYNTKSFEETQEIIRQKIEEN